MELFSKVLLRDTAQAELFSKVASERLYVRHLIQRHPLFRHLACRCLALRGKPPLRVRAPRPAVLLCGPLRPRPPPHPHIPRDGSPKMRLSNELPAYPHRPRAYVSPPVHLRLLLRAPLALRLWFIYIATST